MQKDFGHLIDMNNLPSKTFCILPWIHLSTRPDGQMRVCCTANASSVGATNDKIGGGNVGVLKDDQGKPNNLNVADLITSWNSNYMKTVRKQMLNGDEPPSCSKCYKEERAGHNSKRQWETAYWQQRVDLNDLLQNTTIDGEVPPKLSYIDLRFGTKCQLACVMCSPHDSSSWIKEWQAIYPTLENDNVKEIWHWRNKGSINGSSYNWHKKNPTFWKQFYEQIPHMKQIYFAGGEPLIIDEHYEILEEIIRQDKAKNIELRYNSNGVEWRDGLFDLWKHFKIVRFHYSVDNIYEKNEYIRYPSKWSRTEEVFKILDEQTPDNVVVTVACSISALNVYYIPDFMKWKLTRKFKKINMWPAAAGGLNFHFVYWPAFLNVKILPSWFKDKCEEKYEDFIKWWSEHWHEGIPENLKKEITKEMWENNDYGIQRLRGIISFMKSEDWSNRLPETKDYLEKLDKHRNTSFYETFIEMKDIFNEDVNYGRS